MCVVLLVAVGVYWLFCVEKGMSFSYASAALPAIKGPTITC